MNIILPLFILLYEYSFPEHRNLELLVPIPTVWGKESKVKSSHTVAEVKAAEGMLGFRPWFPLIWRLAWASNFCNCRNQNSYLFL